MERDAHKRRDDDDRAETAEGTINEEPACGEEQADGATGVSQAAYDKAKNDAVKDVHG